MTIIKTLSLSNISEVSEKVSDATETMAAASTNWWTIIAAAELAVILYLAFRYRKLKQASTVEGFQTITEARSNEINMDDLMSNINNSKSLYKKLCAKCHPDRFTEEEQKNKADKIFQEISLNKRNHKRLLELQEEAERELQVKF